jgi:hypothetical protein
MIVEGSVKMNRRNFSFEGNSCSFASISKSDDQIESEFEL